MNAAARAIWARVPEAPAFTMDPRYAVYLLRGVEPIWLDAWAPKDSIYKMDPRALSDPVVRRVSLHPEPYIVMHPVVLALVIARASDAYGIDGTFARLAKLFAMPAAW